MDTSADHDDEAPGEQGRPVPLSLPMAAAVQKTFLINRPQDKVRLSAFRQRATGAGLDFSIFVATDGRSLHPSPNGLSPGEKGCFESHRRVLREISRQSKEGWFLVLEDDAVMSEDFMTKLGVALSQGHRVGAGYIQLGWIPTHEQASRKAVTLARLKASPLIRVPLSKIFKQLPAEPPRVIPAPLGWGTHTYAVTGQYASKILDFLEGEPVAPIDKYLQALQVADPGFIWRTRFPLTSQDWSTDSTVDSIRQASLRHQLDDRGRRRRGDLGRVLLRRVGGL